MAKLPWYFKVIKSDQKSGQMVFRVRNIYVLYLHVANLVNNIKNKLVKSFGNAKHTKGNLIK